MNKKTPKRSDDFQVFHPKQEQTPQSEVFHIFKPLYQPEVHDELDVFFQNPIPPEELLKNQDQTDRQGNHPFFNQSSPHNPPRVPTIDLSQNTPAYEADHGAGAFLKQLTPMADQMLEEEEPVEEASFEDKLNEFDEIEDTEDSKTLLQQRVEARLFWIKTILYLSLITLIVISYQTITSFSGFKINHYSISGNEKIDSDELISYLQLKRNTENFFKIDLLPIEQKLKAHPWIADFKIEKHFPNHLKIEVKEKKTKGVALLGALMAVDESGMPFVAITPKERKNLPIISGLPQSLFDDPQTQKIGQMLMSKAIYTYELYEKSHLKKYKKLSDIYISQTGRIELMLDHTRVSLGNDHFKQRIAYLEKILGYLHEQDTNASYILLSEDLSKAIIEESSFDHQSLVSTTSNTALTIPSHPSTLP